MNNEIKEWYWLLKMHDDFVLSLFADEATVAKQNLATFYIDRFMAIRSKVSRTNHTACSII